MIDVTKAFVKNKGEEEVNVAAQAAGNSSCVTIEEF